MLSFCLHAEVKLGSGPSYDVSVGCTKAGIAFSFITGVQLLTVVG